MFAQHFARKGIAVDAVDLRVPTLETLALSTMIDTACAAIGSARDRAILIGSSLGALTAAHAAARDARVCALVLLAPAFGLSARWRARLGVEGERQWQETGWLPMDDPEGPPRLHYGYMLDADAVEAAHGAAPDVRVPTLLIHGRADDVVPVDGSRAWADGKRHVRMVEVDDGHPLYGSLDRVCTEMDAFLHLQD